jgi:uncharacterized protein (DUF2141 family)
MNRIPHKALPGAFFSLLMAWVVLAPAPEAFAQPASRVVHTWKRIYYGALDGDEALLFIDRIERAKPSFGDIDGDGDPDLLLGTADGRILVFENAGKPGKPDWRLVNDALRANVSSQERPDGPAGSQAIDVGENAAPTLVDIDGDDDLDLFVGSASGKLLFFRNEGNRYLPQYALANPDFLGHSFGGNLSPRFADANRDGAPDLALGNERGEVFLLLNRGTRNAPNFCLAAEAWPDCPAPPEPLVRLHEADNAAPEWVDWDGDGDLDLMVGKSDGRIAFYRNIGTRTAGQWELAEDRFLILDAGGYAAPAFLDADGDGKPDLILAADSELISYYRNTGGSGGFDLWLENKNLLRVKRLGQFDRRLQAASGDLDGDGAPDLVVGGASGQLLLYWNTGDKTRVALRSAPEAILPTPKRASSAPALADIDGDGDLDLIVGDRNGRLELIRNTGSAKAPQWRSEDVFFQRIDVGAMASPFFHDVDGDGDLDLLVGNSLGNLVWFENRGDKVRPDLALRSVRFGNLRVRGNAAPALFPWDPKGPPDLVSGSMDGGLFSAVRNLAIPIAASNAWLPDAEPWGGIQVGSFSAPTFADLSGDGRPDLLVGTGEGGLVLWRYEGSIPIDQIARAGPSPGRNVLPEPGGFELREGAAAVARNDLEALSGGRFTKPEDLPLDPVFSEEQSPLTALRPGRNSFPAFADLDGDGLPDLLVGTAQGLLVHYKNLGPKENPKWQKVTDRFAGYSQGRNAAPAFFDADGDGDLDLVVGNERGRVTYWENTGPREKPVFRMVPDALRNVLAVSNAVPMFADLDGDRVPELIVGNLKGGLFLYRRKPGGGPLDYDLTDRRFAGLNAGISAAPTVADLTLDRKLELLIGSDQGKIYAFQRTGTSPFYSSGWKRNDALLQGLTFSAGSHPAVLDLDGDGDPDLVVGSDKGELRFFRNTVLAPEREELTGSR